MTLAPLQHEAAGNRRREAAGRWESSLRRGFSLVELLVVITIILALMGLVGVAVSAASSSVKASGTRQLIEKLDLLLKQQLATYDSKAVNTAAAPAGMKNAYRAWSIRRNLISGDLPDRWSNVEYMYQTTDLFGTPSHADGLQFPKGRLTGSQRNYLAIWRDLVRSGRSTAVAGQNASAECLFMIVTQGGIADCLDCGDLRSAQVGDQDGDGMLEFWDDWKNPIRFLLWAPGLKLPSGSADKFFDGPRALDAPWSGSPRPTLGMRPLIYSPGPDEKSGYDRSNEAVTLSLGSGPVGAECGSSQGSAGSPIPDEVQYTLDNITNFDAEAKP
ncbi:MAG: prepilin-type N-terminal cleavage/methylation domain-containing protein [Planctomycetes bacterium]|nr:prepilin-type N-terminal cleavage/methylation domain-containing protein [Planctomycetota bacterium]